jgi:hypothetical protein
MMAMESKMHNLSLYLHMHVRHVGAIPKSTNEDN